MRIELQEIRKHFGLVRANDGITLTLEGGRIYGLLGENGAGKSTLMKILSGYQQPDHGSILLDGELKRFKSPSEALSAGIGMLYQEPHDLPPFRIIENYLLGRDRHVLLDLKAAISELDDLASRYGFAIDTQAYIENLSLGERQQLELIRLLAGGAQILILDEPTTGISAEQKDLLFGSIRKLVHEEGKTLILVSHKLEEVRELCEHVFVLRHGMLVGEEDIPCSNERLVSMMFGRVPERTEREEFDLGSPILQVKDVSISTYRLTIDNINLDVYSGEIFGLAGLEGSGQRLLLQACAGLLPITRGKIFLGDEDVSRWTYHRFQKAGVAYVAAGRLEEGLIDGLTITEHVELAQPEHSFLVDWSSARRTATERIDQYQIIGRPESTADELSGGNQQRLLFALLNSPLKLILLEHPTRGLDVRSTDWIWELLYQRRTDGTSIVFISADLDEIIERSDRIAVFSGGVMSRILDATQTNVDELGHLIGGNI